MVLEGNPQYTHHFNGSDALSLSQKAFLEEQWKQFKSWWSQWPGSKA
jgi:4-hydroxy-tetrahydrodipicolinate synthase